MIKLMNKKRKKKGFTLIELVAVVAIIGILAALLVPKIAGYVEDAKKTKAIDQARKVVMAFEAINIKKDTPVKEDAINVTSIIADNPTGDAKLMKDYIAPSTGDDVKKILANLGGSLNVANCRAITEGASFELDKDSKATMTATPSAPQG
ncbi:type II secretion system protein [Clostridium baratii]|uniref:type II secretion system protein n=1 Tax=Clostridium baratii TaxID=1561 RepID=UPI003D34B23A